MVTTFERENTFKTQVTWKSGSTNIDPSSNMSFLKVIEPDGTVMFQDVSGVRSATGIYHYYVSTQTSDDLGLYKIQWYAYFNYGSPFNYQIKYDTEVINLVAVKQG